MLHQDLNGAVCEVRGGIVISPKIAPWKRTRVDELVEILGSDGVIGIVDIDGVPGKNMLDMRASLRSKLTITMAKKPSLEEHGSRPEKTPKLWSNCLNPRPNLLSFIQIQ